MRYDDHARFDWQFVPRPKRKGLPLSEMDIRQKRLAIDVLKLAYSAAGFEKIEKIRDQQNYLHEKQNQDPPHCCGNYGNACGNPDSAGCPTIYNPDYVYFDHSINQRLRAIGDSRSKDTTCRSTSPSSMIR